MREFAQDPEAKVHPQTVIEHFGTWNAAKRAAGLFPRRFLTRDELLDQLRALGVELGRTPTARDLAARRRALPSASLYAHTFGSLANALREAGFEVLRGEERLERAVAQGAILAKALGRLPKMADWAEARRNDAGLLSEWQVYRLLEAPRGAWTAFQFLVRATPRPDRRRRAGRAGRPLRRASQTVEARHGFAGPRTAEVAVWFRPSGRGQRSRTISPSTTCRTALADFVGGESHPQSRLTIVSARRVDAKRDPGYSVDPQQSGGMGGKSCIVQLVHPRCSHRAPQLRKRPGIVAPSSTSAGSFGWTDISGPSRSSRTVEEHIVVRDDAVVNTDDGAVDRMGFAWISGCPL
jgi:hypothetical protein